MGGVSDPNYCTGLWPGGGPPPRGGTPRPLWVRPEAGGKNPLFFVSHGSPPPLVVPGRTLSPRVFKKKPGCGMRGRGRFGKWSMHYNNFKHTPPLGVRERWKAMSPLNFQIFQSHNPLYFLFQCNAKSNVKTIRWHYEAGVWVYSGCALSETCTLLLFILAFRPN